MRGRLMVGKKSQKRWSYEEVKKYFEEHNCVLLSNEYKNTKKKLDYICECGNKSIISFEMFKNGTRCKECAKKRIGKKNGLSFEFVENYFIENECKLLTSEYINNSTKMNFVCQCGNNDSLTFKEFKRYKSCRKCQGIIVHNFDYVFNFFKQNQCELLSTKYINMNTPLEYICACGGKEETTFHKFKYSDNKRCKKCTYKIRGAKQSFSYEEVKETFEVNNCILITDHYINSSQELDYICQCGNHSKIKFNDFKNGVRCKECGNKKVSDSKLKSYDEVNVIFKERGCVLLSTEYLGNNKPLKYLCKCGIEDYKTLTNFISNPKCDSCKSEYLSSIRKGKEFPHLRGEKHPNWDHSKTKEEREKNRWLSEQKIWRKEVYERDNYTCQCCGDDRGGNLIAHHLDGYDWCKVSRWDTDNGITLCDVCHNSFHGIYGYGLNTREQFEEYIEGISWNCSGLYKDIDKVT